MIYLILLSFWTFQSTHPRGVRLELVAQPHPEKDFNPRTRVGCDRPEKRQKLKPKHFNPRTRVGCDSKRRLA